MDFPLFVLAHIVIKRDIYPDQVLPAMARGTDHSPAERFKRLNCPLSFLSKKNNIAGIQLADLCAHPCARHILNPQKENRAFEIARKHLYENGGTVG